MDIHIHDLFVRFYPSNHLYFKPFMLKTIDASKSLVVVYHAISS